MAVALQSSAGNVETQEGCWILLQDEESLGCKGPPSGGGAGGGRIGVRRRRVRERQSFRTDLEAAMSENLRLSNEIDEVELELAELPEPTAIDFDAIVDEQVRELAQDRIDQFLALQDRLNALRAERRRVRKALVAAWFLLLSAR